MPHPPNLIICNKTSPYNPPPPLPHKKKSMMIYQHTWNKLWSKGSIAKDFLKWLCLAEPMALPYRAIFRWLCKIFRLKKIKFAEFWWFLCIKHPYLQRYIRTLILIIVLVIIISSNFASNHNTILKHVRKLKSRKDEGKSKVQIYSSHFREGLELTQRGALLGYPIK